MDPELIELLARLADADNPLTDEELAAVQEGIRARVAEIDPATASDDDLELLREAVSYNTAIQAEIEQRSSAQAERAAAAAALLLEITPPVDETPDPEEGTGDPEGTADADAGDGEPPEPEAAVEPPVGEAEPIAAAAEPERRLPTISHLAARSPRTHRPVATATARASAPALIASADIPGVAAGEVVDLERWAVGVARKIDAFSKSQAVARGEKVHLASIKVSYPEDRILAEDETINEARIQAVVGKAALVASGGVCSPVAVSYDVASIGVADRPVRDGQAQFAATRGGLRYIRPHTLAQVTADGPATLWTEANDVAPSSPATKPHAVFECQNVVEDFVDAVTSIVQFGNFQARYFPEQVAQYLETVDAVHARLAEATLLASMTTGSTAVNAGVNLLGAASEVLAEIDRAVAGYRFRHRMAIDSPLRVVYPEWLEDMIRADLAREQPGNSGGQSERLAVADAEIDRFFAVRNLNVTKTLDSPTGANPTQGFGIQGAGDLLPWPSKVIVWIYHEGAWMFLDGGELNLGLVRDSVLNRTNDFQMFSETFEKSIFRGHESLALTLDTCVSGQRANTVDTSTYCTSGS